MTDKQKTKWFDTPFIGQYSVLDFSRTGMALIFIFICMTFLAMYIQQSIQETSEDKKSVIIEYVNVQQTDILSDDGSIILEAPDLVIDRVVHFPISYGHEETAGYILLDAHTGVRYLFVRYGGAHGAVAMTRYLTEHEHVHEHEDQYDDIIKDNDE